MNEVNGHSKNGLPKDWKETKLGSVCQIVYGKGLPTKNLKESGYPVFGANGIIGFNDTFHYEEPQVLISCRGAYSGKINFSPAKCFVTNNSLVLQIKEKSALDKQYLYYALKAVNKSKLVTGTAQPQVTINNAVELSFPLPPYKEQQQIVSKIEELFSELDKSIEQLKTAQQQLKVYRQSVLKWAFEGKLTNKNVKDGELPDGWKEAKIEDVASVGTGATPLKGKKEYYENGQIPWVTSGALNEEYVKTSTDFVTEKALIETNLTIYPKHTLLLAMYGEGKTRGKCSELLIEATTNQAIAAIYFAKHDMRVKPFLKYFLLKNYNDIRRLSSGGVQPNLNLGIVKRTVLPFPPLEEQQQIVQEIESRLSVADKLEETITNSLQQAEALRQSILKKAFEGKLIF
jgi:type I restriction enzyme, S subunit